MRLIWRAAAGMALAVGFSAPAMAQSWWDYRHYDQHDRLAEHRDFSFQIKGHYLE